MTHRPRMMPTPSLARQQHGRWLPFDVASDFFFVPFALFSLAQPNACQAFRSENFLKPHDNKRLNEFFPSVSPTVLIDSCRSRD